MELESIDQPHLNQAMDKVHLVVEMVKEVEAEVVSVDLVKVMVKEVVKVVEDLADLEYL